MTLRFKDNISINDTRFTYQIKDRQIDVEINENVSARVNIPVTFSATDTAATATFTNGQLTANVDVAA